MELAESHDETDLGNRTESKFPEIEYTYILYENFVNNEILSRSNSESLTRSSIYFVDTDWRHLNHIIIGNY